MVSIKMHGVYRVTAKGRTYHYAWRGGPRLLCEPGTPEFVEELAEAQAARLRGPPGTIAGLCALYRASDDWLGLSKKTRASWTTWLDRIQIKFGPLSIRQFDRPVIRVHIRKWRDVYKAKPRSADMGLQVLSRVLSFAVSEGMISTNPVKGISRVYRNDRSEVIWTDDDLAALRKVTTKEVMWAADLAALTGLRQGDLLRLSWSHIGPLAIELRTGKSNQRKTTLIPLYAELRALLEAIPKRSPVVLTNTRGVPWRGGFGSSWQDAVKAAKTDKHFHDLRGTFATRAWLAGFTIREIAELLTWSEDQVESMLNRYVKKDELLRARIRRMDEAGTEPAKPSAKPI